MRAACGEHVGEELADSIALFAADAIAVVGLSEVRGVIEREVRVEYDRARRAASIRAELPGVKDHRGLDLAAGRDVDLLLAYLDSLWTREEKLSPIRMAKLRSPPPKDAAKPATLEDLKAKFGGRR